LLCEEIDVGEEKPRSIASGLRAHYSKDEMQGKKVIILANLKERPMAGFKSQVCGSVDYLL
jgi:tRNA-binding EMAP/Myf-like protein